MKIAATAVSMDAARTSKEMEQRITGVSMGVRPGAGQIDAFGVRLGAMLASTTQTQSVSQAVIRPVDGNPIPPVGSGSESASPAATILAQLTGQAIGQPVTVTALEEDMPAASSAEAAVPVLEVGVRSASLVSGTVYCQEESLHFSARGVVQTSDGREIAFDLGLTMERHTVAAEFAALDVAPLLIDPLILQFELDSPLLGPSTFLFDLDSDGNRESLACPGTGCGFLALDRNDDGLINDGLELFGPESGSGFGELAALDSDANLWIDENDPIFAHLLIWTPDGQGGESLRSLREAGVGAIAVTHAGTDFQLRHADGTIHGEIKASGIFLTEAGEVRSLQEVDLALPGTSSGIGPENSDPAARQLEVALLSLRAIVTMQRLRLRMMLNGERLRGALARAEDQRELVLRWLDGRNDQGATGAGAITGEQPLPGGQGVFAWLGDGIASHRLAMEPRRTS